MSLVTRCPACTTTFKVVRDQLRISDGWVRCGRCSHVFDASLDLTELSDVAPAAGPSQAQASDSEPDPEPPTPPDPATAGDVDFFEVEAIQPGPGSDPGTALPPLPSLSFDANPAAGLVADEPWPDPVESGVGDPAPALQAARAVPSVADLAPSLELDAVSQVQLQKALRRARVESARIARAQEKDGLDTAVTAESATASVVAPSPEIRDTAHVVQMASEPELPPLSPPIVPSFLRAASSSVFWRSGKGLALSWTAVGLAAIVLIVQVLHRERDAIAASQPALRPVLSQLCVVTGCELGALRRIDEIIIDGAAFSREKVGEGYRLGFTLRNAAGVPLAMPAVELSLLDTQEQVVVRRVLQPAEFGAPAVLAARAERAASLPLALAGPDAAALQPIAGYRVVAFYP